MKLFSPAIYCARYLFSRRRHGDATFVIPAKAGIQFCLAPLLATGAFFLPLAAGVLWLGVILPPNLFVPSLYLFLNFNL